MKLWLNHRRQPTPRFRSVCISRQRRGAAAAKRWPENIMRLMVAMCVFVTGCVAQAAVSVPTPAPLSISVSLPAEGSFGASNETRRLSFRASPPLFHVVVANTSSSDIRLWKEDCSWGYGALSFSFRDSGGNEWVARKKPRAWRSNYPRWWLLKPNETLIIDVRFAESSVWDGFKRPAKDSNLKLAITAMFEIASDENSREHQTWTGKIVSKPIEVTFYD